MAWLEGAPSGGAMDAIGTPAALSAAMPQPWSSTGFGGNEDPTAARRRALVRMLMNGASGGMGADNPAFRTSEGTIGMTIAAAIPALAGLMGGMFGGGGAGGAMKPWKV